MQEDDAGNYVGWLINMWVVMPLISMPLSDVLSFWYHLLNFAIKVTKKKNLKRLFFAIASKLSSRLSANVSSSSKHWFGDLYREIKLHYLPPILISKLMHSWRK